MDNSRVAIIAVIIENSDSAKSFNELLHEYSEYIIGRMGIPYRCRNVNIVSVAIDAPRDVMTADVKEILAQLKENKLII